VLRLEYDPNRTAFIALVKYPDDKLSYILSPQGLKAGDKVMSSLSTIEPKVGNCMKIEHIPVGSIIHNIEIKPGAGGKLAKAAGNFAKLLGKNENYAKIEMKSSEVRLIHLSCKATIGAISNEDHHHIVLAKAGRSRWLGRRPHVRGVAMNPVDHPHGGGEGKTSGGRIPVTPWGKKTKGKKTRHNKRTQKFIISKKKK
jgi:large subunit ribosomal protein L2